MTDRASGSYTVKSWDEKDVAAPDGGGRVTRASVTGEYAGEIEGSATTESVMTYRPDGTAEYVGMERIVGRVGGRSGSFVLRSVGRYDGRTALSEMEVVAGLGSGELNGLRGEGRFRAEHGPKGSLELDYRFE
jgi:hypothetical protein